MGRSMFDETQVFTARAQFLAADTTVAKTVVTAAQIAGQRVDNILICNSDGIAHNVTFSYLSSGVTYYLGSVAVPSGAGHAGVAPVDAIPLLIPAGQVGLLFDNTTVLQARMEVTVVTGQVDLLFFGGFF